MGWQVWYSDMLRIDLLENILILNTKQLYLKVSASYYGNVTISQQYAFLLWNRDGSTPWSVHYAVTSHAIAGLPLQY